MNPIDQNRVRQGLTKAIMLASVASGPLYAEAPVLEELVVTAQKREENLQDVSVSITAFGGNSIRDFGWSNSEDVAAQTPGLIGTSFSGDSSITVYSLRGVGQNDFADHQEAPTAMYVDGVYVGYTGAAGVQMFDVDRVEVLRGPQGTLFGRNATGGLVHLISKQPTEEFEAYADVTVGSFNQVRLEGAVGGAVSDSLLARLSILSDDADGYFRNTLGRDTRERDFTSARLQLDFKPSDNAEVDITLWSNETDKAAGGTYDFRTSFVTLGDSPTDFAGTPDESPEPNEGAVAILGFIDKEAYGGDLTVSVDFENFTLTSITGYGDYEKSYQESEGTSTPTSSFFYRSSQDSTQFSQEIRLNGDTDSMRWQTGLYYLNLDGDFIGNEDFPSFGGAAINDYTVETESWSVFAQVEYDFTDDLTLIAGLRWVTDEKDLRLDPTCEPSVLIPENTALLPGFPLNDCSVFTSGDPAAPIIAELGRTINQTRDDDEIAANIRLNYKVSEEVLLYAGYSRGVKGGGFTVPVDGFLTESELSYDPEILHSYEVGVKSTLLDGRLRLNASAFYYDYTDYQAFIFVGLTSQVLNRDAEIKGGEIELTAIPSDGWEVQLGLSLLDATVSDIPGFAGDQDMIAAPDVTANFMVKRAWETDLGEFALQVDGIYVDEQQYNTNNSDLTLGDSYELFNARASYTSNDGRWEVAAFVRNLADEEFITYRFDLAAFFGNSLLVYGPPRWAGLQARYNW